MAETRHIADIIDTDTNLQANLDNNQFAVQTDGSHKRVYKDHAGGYHVLANTAEAESFTTLTVTADALVADTIQHYGDADTKLTFAADDITISAGGVDFVKITEDTQDVIKINPNSGDVDTVINANSVANALVVDGATGYLGTRIGTPTNHLDFNIASASLQAAFSVYSATAGQEPLIMLRKSTGTTIGTPASTGNADYLGAVTWWGVNGAGTPAFTNSAAIIGIQVGVAGAVYDAAKLLFQTGTAAAAPTTKLTIWDTGGISIGVNSQGADNFAKLNSEFQFGGSNGTSRSTAYCFSDTAAHLTEMGFVRSHHDTYGTWAATVDTENLGQIIWRGVLSDNSTLYIMSTIRGVQVGAAGATYNGAKIEAYTGTNAAAAALRMTISDAGNVCIGALSNTSSVAYDSLLHVWSASAGTVEAPSGTLITAESDGNAYITCLIPNDKQGGLIVGDNNDNDVASLIYSHSNNGWSLTAGAKVMMCVESTSGFVFNPDGASGGATASVDIIQDSTSGAKPVLYVKQDDIDKSFISFESTIGSTITSTICDQADAGGNYVFSGGLQILVNGAIKYLKYYDLINP